MSPGNVPGDGVNHGLALHAADVEIPVDSGSDVAKDAADVILLQKDLGVLAGNMFSAVSASIFLPFLPMLPSHILLNNLLYGTSQLAILIPSLTALGAAGGPVVLGVLIWHALEFWLPIPSRASPT